MLGCKSIYNKVSKLRYLSTTKTSKLLTMANWYYATDVPNKKPYEPDFKPNRPPRKFKQFPGHDTKKLEFAYTNAQRGSNLVRVGEDELFHVDLNEMILTSTYWKGAVFEVRRGVWFDNNKVPLPHKLSLEIEKHIKDWRKGKNEGMSGKYSSSIEKTTEDENLEDELKDKDLRKLVNSSNEWGKYILFISEKEAYLLPNLEGGSLHLNYLKTALAQFLTINGKRITSSIKENEVVEESDSDESDFYEGVCDSLVSPFLNWNFYDQITNNWTNKKGKMEIKEEPAPISNKIVESDYDDQNNSTSELQERKVDHLVLCVHGVAQTLGKKYEYVNFAHSINMIRSNMKEVYQKSKDMKKLNNENNKDDWETNCNVQLLPITWRHSIGFETGQIKNRRENPNLPIMSDVTIRNVLPIRQLINDVVVDVGLYEDPYYKDIIINEVRRQLNDTYTLYKKNNNFNGKVHLMGHSLGSSILYDILSDQKQYKLDFDVDRFFCLGSPIGLFKVVQRATLLPHDMDKSPLLDSDQPKCNEIYNVFHLCDPVAHRMEPLVDPTMALYDYVTIPHLSEFDGFASKLFGISESIKDKISESVSSSKSKENSDVKLPDLLTRKLLALNHNGRLDYVMPPNLFEVDMISVIISHMLYFEDLDVAGFMLQEILKKSEKSEKIDVVPFENT